MNCPMSETVVEWKRFISNVWSKLFGFVIRLNKIHQSSTGSAVHLGFKCQIYLLSVIPGLKTQDSSTEILECGDMKTGSVWGRAKLMWVRPHSIKIVRTRRELNNIMYFMLNRCWFYSSNNNQPLQRYVQQPSLLASNTRLCISGSSEAFWTFH